MENVKLSSLPNHSDSALPEPGKPPNPATLSVRSVMSRLLDIRSRSNVVQEDLELCMRDLKEFQVVLSAAITSLGSQ